MKLTRGSKKFQGLRRELRAQGLKLCCCLASNGGDQSSDPMECQVGLGGLPVIPALRRWRWDSHSKLARQTSYTYKLCVQVRDSASIDKVESNQRQPTQTVHLHTHTCTGIHRHAHMYTHRHILHTHEENSTREI